MKKPNKKQRLEIYKIAFKDLESFNRKYYNSGLCLLLMEIYDNDKYEWNDCSNLFKEFGVYFDCNSCISSFEAGLIFSSSSSNLGSV